MPNYLTPGVYVEEIPSQSKPIEGVGTSVAAFVGLAPGGPVNVPQRIANWSQFERMFSDPAAAHPTPFMEGAYLAHAVYGFFHNGGTLCWVVRVGGEETAPKATLRSSEMVALPSGEKEHPAAFDVVAKDNASEPITAELVEEAPKRGQNGNGGEKTYSLTVKAGRVTEAPYQGLLLKDLAKTVTEKSKLVEITETAEAKKLLPGTYRLNVPSVKPSALTQEQVEGDEAEREGLEGVTAVEEVTIVCVPDLMAMLNDGNGNVADAEKILRALQSKVVEGCENAGQRMAILDPRRIASRTRYSTGFSPRISIPSSPRCTGRGSRSSIRSRSDRSRSHPAATSRASGAAPTPPAECTRRLRTRSCSAPTISPIS